MFHILEKSIAQAVAAKISQTFQTDAAVSTAVSVEQPKDAAFGEFALPVAFQLARPLRKAPKAIAEELKTQLTGLPGVATIEIAGNGYLNLRLDRAAYFASLAHPLEAEARAGKIIVEHTNINPNKAAHIGHLRNSILGDTFVRMLRASGESVEVQNYIDNTGVQVADVVVGFHYLEKKTIADVTQLIAQPRFDYYCWDLYARTSSYYAENKDALAWRAETLHAIESGHGEVAELAHLVADAIVQRHLLTMSRLDIAYNVLPRESEILHLKFWASAFELLKQRQAIYLETEGKNKGCWVMPASAFKENSNAASEEDGAEDSKVIVRSNGIVTYVGKDIAYQLWKFGLLGKDFHYRPLEHWPGVWVSTGTPQSEPAPSFGSGKQVYNVIDSRQSYLQDVVVAGLRALGFADQAERSIHFSYEMVALSPRTCAELGIPLSEEDKKKPYVEVSGRKGLGVKADDLIDKLIENALREVDSRNADKPAGERRQVATQIAIGALRYFMLKFTRNTVIAFDLQEALAFTGETGPYVQYAAVRARKILSKLPAVDLTNVSAAPLADENLWQLLLAISKLDYSLERSLASGEPSHMARYAFQLAQAFSGFYENYPVRHEADAEKQKLLIWMTDYFARQLGRTCEILGIPVPQYM